MRSSSPLFPKHLKAQLLLAIYLRCTNFCKDVKNLTHKNVGRESGGSRASEHRLRRRRRVGDVPQRGPDLCPRRHPGHRRRLQQPPVGRREKEPGEAVRGQVEGQNYQMIDY